MKRETMWEQNATQREINNMTIVCWRCCCNICCWNSSTNIHAAYFLSLESHHIGQSIYGVFFRGIREMWINRMEFNVLAISIRLSVCVWCTELSFRCSLVRNEYRCVSEKIQQEPKFALQNHPNWMTTYNRTEFAYLISSMAWRAAVSPISWFWNIERNARVFVCVCLVSSSGFVITKKYRNNYHSIFHVSDSLARMSNGFFRCSSIFFVLCYRSQ